MSRNDFFTGRTGFGGTSTSPKKRGSSQKSSNDFFQASGAMDEIGERYNDLINDASKALASYAVSKNKSGASDMNTISQEINSMLKPFSAEDRATILRKAIASMIVSL